MKFDINKDNVPDNRLRIIVKLIEQDNNISLQEIANKLNVSKRTIRSLIKIIY